MAFYWEDDDLGCIREIEALEELFTIDLGYDVEKYGLPSDRPQLFLRRKVLDAIDRCGKKSHLLILYYGGHGEEDGKRRKSVWSAYVLHIEVVILLCTEVNLTGRIQVLRKFIGRVCSQSSRSAQKGMFSSF